MKQRKIELALLVVTVGFVCFCVGLFLGRRHEPDTVTITTDLAVAQPSAESVSPSVQVQEESEPTPTESSSASYIAGRLNINTATVEELTTLPGIGEKLAERIIDYREKNGSFSAVEELCNVSGIGEKRLDAIREYITVG